MSERILSVGDENLTIPCMVCEGFRVRLAEAMALIAVKDKALEQVHRIVNNHIDENLGPIYPDQLIAVYAALSAKMRSEER